MARKRVTLPPPLEESAPAEPATIEGLLAPGGYVDPEGFVIVRDAAGKKYRVKRDACTDLGDMRVSFVP